MRSVAVLLALLSFGCGDNLTGPDGQTQARVVSNNSWRLSANGVDRVGINTVGAVFEIGAGEQCATARLSLARQPPPADGSFLTLTVGQRSETIRTDDRAITVCGRGPVS